MTTQALQRGGLFGPNSALRRPEPEFIWFEGDRYPMGSQVIVDPRLPQERQQQLRQLNLALMGGAEGIREHTEHMNRLRDRAFDEETEEMMGTWEYWQDFLKRIPAMAAGQWKTLDEETGEAEWRRPPHITPITGFESPEILEQIMALNEQELERQREEPFSPGIWQDTKSLAAIPSMLGMGDPPEFALEAMDTSEEIARSQERQWDLEEPRGFPQHLAGATGTMAAQLPMPAAATRQVLRPLNPLLKKIPRPVSAVGAPVVEFFNPTINPSLRNYMQGIGAGTLIGSATEPSGSEREEARMYNLYMEQVEEAEQNAPEMIEFVEENWENVGMEDRVNALYDPFYGETIWQALTPHQQLEMMEELEDRGLLDPEDIPDAE